MKEAEIGFKVKLLAMTLCDKTTFISSKYVWKHWLKLFTALLRKYCLSCSRAIPDNETNCMTVLSSKLLFSANLHNTSYFSALSNSAISNFYRSVGDMFTFSSSNFSCTLGAFKVWCVLVCFSVFGVIHLFLILNIYIKSLYSLLLWMHSLRLFSSPSRKLWIII